MWASVWVSVGQQTVAAFENLTARVIASLGYHTLLTQNHLDTKRGPLSESLDRPVDGRTSAPRWDLGTSFELGCPSL